MGGRTSAIQKQPGLPGREEGDGVVAIRVGCGISFFGGSEAFDCDFRSDDDGTVLVFNSPGDAARGLTLGKSENSDE